jgi:hypothetical protein
VAFITMAVLAVLGFLAASQPERISLCGFAGGHHARPASPTAVMEPLGTKRIIIAIVTLLVFFLCFWPFPITIT